jgi:hypothetical protein
VDRFSPEFLNREVAFFLEIEESGMLDFLMASKVMPGVGAL